MRPARWHGLSGCGDFSLYVLKRVATVSMEIRVAESPGLCEGDEKRRDDRWGATLTCSPNWLSSVFLTYGRSVR
jgi:hypothetical protein